MSERDDPLHLIGAGVLAIFAKWLFERVLLKIPRPRKQAGTAALSGEMSQVREQLELLQGIVTGMDSRIRALEQRRAAGVGD